MCVYDKCVRMTNVCGCCPFVRRLPTLEFRQEGSTPEELALDAEFARLRHDDKLDGSTPSGSAM